MNEKGCPNGQPFYCMYSIFLFGFVFCQKALSLPLIIAKNGKYSALKNEIKLHQSPYR